MPAEKRYITTAIDYVNAPPHLGHALEKIEADVLARYYRAHGARVHFLTGSDEHGTKIARAAEAAGKSPKDFVDGLVEKFKDMRELFNLSWDDFIRTTDEARHFPGAEKLWRELVKAGDIYKKTYRGLYCVGHEAFITEKDLVDGKCSDHKKEPEVIEEENYFFRLSKYTGQIEEKIKNEELLILPEGRRNEILSLLSKGLDDISFSRPRKNLAWGIPVPDDEEQTMYVWADALSNYISAIGYGRDEDEFKKWWPADIHVIGKDILRFHAAIWPGMLLSAGLPLPKRLYVHGFITIEGEKMSKSVGNVIDPVVLAKKYGTDPLRYYLIREIPSNGDGDFSESKFVKLYNSDLANGVGNFAARVLTLAEKSGPLKKDALDSSVEAAIEKARKDAAAHIEDFRLHEAIAAIWTLIGFGDEYVNRHEVWKISDGAEKTKVLFNLVTILDNVAALLLPFLPETAGKITGSIKWSGDNLEIKKGEVLFPRLQ
jgi:methionyl-tRNA synthetase